ncbi:hypothetical protein [Candidatus Skiveiella danica]|uniref:hypothetical protein n=1 Tax=Candidatus Skiveiella danica TaxID=3386177 RepID=UPI0039B82AFC
MKQASRSLPLPTAIFHGLVLLICFVIPGAGEGRRPRRWHLLARSPGTIAAIIGKAC